MEPWGSQVQGPEAGRWEASGVALVVGGSGTAAGGNTGWKDRLRVLSSPALCLSLLRTHFSLKRWTSLLVQWLRLCFHCRGHRFHP